MLPTPFSLSLLIRSVSVLLPQTFFQPDEFYQALEPAHHLIFGYGHLTWEWKDLPVISGDEDWWSVLVEGGRMRGWLWPGFLALLYRGLHVLGLDETFLITFLPRVIGVLIAAMTDYQTYRLSGKLLGDGSSAAALFLSLTSFFNAHLLPRALSTSPETLLTTLALVYFPLPAPATPQPAKAVTDASTKERPETVEASLSNAASAENTKATVTGTESSKEAITKPTKPKVAKRPDYHVMDRIGPDVTPRDEVKESLSLAVIFATLAFCIRPTTIPFWAYMGLEHVIRLTRMNGVGAAFLDIIKALTSTIPVLAASTTLDYLITGRLYFPILTFISQNVFLDLSSFYGSTNPLYHLTQSLPIMLFPLWYWWAKGYVACLLPTSMLPTSLAALDRPEGLRALSRALTFAIGVLSLSPHSEWRFLHPFLPPLLLFALPPLFRAYTIRPVLGFTQALRQYTRLPRRPYYLILFAPMIPYLYLNVFHGRAQVEVMNVLRRGQLGEVEGLVALMPCHSTPWASHLHMDVPGWFLTCEPPVGLDRESHRTQQSIFYEAPLSYLQKNFPSPPLGYLGKSQDIRSVGKPSPSHIMLFGSLLDQAEYIDNERLTMRDGLQRLGYEEVWKGWNGFDWAQDEVERRGGVRVWRKGVGL